MPSAVLRPQIARIDADSQAVKAMSCGHGPDIRQTADGRQRPTALSGVGWKPSLWSFCRRGPRDHGWQSGRGQRPDSASSSTCGVSDALQIEQLGYLELRRDRSFNGTQPQDGWKVTAAAVNLRQQDSRDRGQARRVDDQRRGLPLLRRQRHTGQEFPHLLVERPLVVEMRRHRNHTFNIPPGQLSNAGKLRIRERMTEVDKKHSSAPVGIRSSVLSATTSAQHVSALQSLLWCLFGV